jgi:hypothetical protein
LRRAQRLHGTSSWAEAHHHHQHLAAVLLVLLV